MSIAATGSGGNPLPLQPLTEALPKSAVSKVGPDANKQWEALQEKVSKASRAEHLASSLDREIKSVLRIDGKIEAWVTDHGGMMIQGKAERLPYHAILNEADQRGLGGGAGRAEFLTQGFAEAANAKFGSAAEMTVHPDGARPTRGEMAAEMRGYDNVNDLIRGQHSDLLMDSEAFAILFGE